jgi:hypothetical protein
MTEQSPESIEANEAAGSPAAAPSESTAAEKLAKTIELHGKWSRGEDGGVRADLTRANLYGANLYGADLTRANLTRANLTRANLTGADLNDVKCDLIMAILRLPNEIPFLRTAIAEGRVDGSTYTGKCACLAGTMAQACGVNMTDFKCRDLMPVDACSPREKWFLAIRPGDTPDKSQVAAITLDWVDEALSIVATIRNTIPGLDKLAELLESPPKA